jgi:quercetin dioxygenase-like cupin family protein
MELIRMGALEIRFLRSKHDTGGALDMFELLVPPGARVPVAHYHERWEETVYGLEGEMTWIIGGEEITTGPGDHAFIPRGVVHQFVNRAARAARVLGVLTPGVLGPEYFRELAILINAGPPDPAAIGAIMRRHGLIPAPG